MVSKKQYIVVAVLALVFVGPTAFASQTPAEPSAVYGGAGAVIALIDGDPAVGPYATLRFPFGSASGAWGLDVEALYELAGDTIDEADLGFAGQLAVGWSLRSLLELPERVELRAGGRAGAYIEVERTEVDETGGGTSIEEGIEPYPTIGAYVTGTWPFGNRVSVETRVTADGIAAPRLGFSLGLRFR